MVSSTAQTVLESTLTACDVEEVLPAGSIHLDVSLSDVVLVFAQCQVTVLLAVETDQRLAVTTTLLAQAQRHAAPEHTRHSIIIIIIIIVWLVRWRKLPSTQECSMQVCSVPDDRPRTDVAVSIHSCSRQNVHTIRYKMPF